MLLRNSLKSSDMDHDGTHFDGNDLHIFAIFGASVRNFHLIIFVIQY